MSLADSLLSQMMVRATLPASAVTSMRTVFDAPGSRVMTRPVLPSSCPSTVIVAAVLSAVAVSVTELTFAATCAEYSSTRGSKFGLSCAPTSCRRASLVFVSLADSLLSQMMVRAVLPASAVTSTMTVFAAPGPRVMIRPVLPRSCPSTSIVAAVLSAVAVSVTEFAFDATCAEYSSTRGSKFGASWAPRNCRRASRALVSLPGPTRSRLSQMMVCTTLPVSAVTSMMTVFEAPG